MFNSFLKKIINTTVNTDEEETKERIELGITPELLQLVDNISKYPESFKDFPFHTLKDHSLKMTKLQKRHVEKILEIVKPLNDLRYQICPKYMDDEKFWKIYFTHIKSVTKGIFEPTGTITNSNNKSNDFLDELDSQFDKLSLTQKKIMLDEGISEEEDSYFSENKYKLSFINNINKEQQQQQQQQNSNNTPIKEQSSPINTINTNTTSSNITSPISPSTQINNNMDNNEHGLIDTSFDNIENNNIDNINNNIDNNNYNNTNNNNLIDTNFDTLGTS